MCPSKRGLGIERKFLAMIFWKMKLRLSIKCFRTYKIGKGLTTKGSANFLGVIVFSLAVGKVAGSMGNNAATFVRFVTEFNEIVTKLVIIVMW